MAASIEPGVKLVKRSIWHVLVPANTEFNLNVNTHWDIFGSAREGERKRHKQWRENFVERSVSRVSVTSCRWLEQILTHYLRKKLNRRKSVDIVCEKT